ncbi:hypothetical protein MMYC01_202860 [Madurella mycetomatis]|uniref:Large ribosomal subunit protein mL54 n=1 Tax=Madurella mycetomatis TaxID=100816 RepID=A0A175WAX9_9PEZI|nr:hypothetical protein MMYC01_202860 [Madurella mycetomatis]
MICRACLRRAAGLTTRQLAPRPLASTIPARTFTTTLAERNAAPAAADSKTPDLTPITPSNPDAVAEVAKSTPVSSCPAGTVLSGLNYFKGKTDPVARPDEEYPAWLWNCLEVQKKADASADVDAGDEFSKSKKQRRLALKRQRQQEERILASGNLEALAPKIPLHKQSVNLTAAEAGDVQQAIAAVDERETLRKAMRKDRKANIKESNYLKGM